MNYYQNFIQIKMKKKAPSVWENSINLLNKSCIKCF